jgi:hypothetical protein
MNRLPLPLITKGLFPVCLLVVMLISFESLLFAVLVSDAGPVQSPIQSSWLVYHPDAISPSRGYLVQIQDNITHVRTADGRQLMVTNAYHWQQERMPPPSFPTRAQLITTMGDRIVGQCRGVDDDRLVWSSTISATTNAPWRIPFSVLQAAWLTDLPVGLPLDCHAYPWLRQYKNQDVFLLRNGDRIAGTLLENSPAAMESPWHIQTSTGQISRFTSEQIAAIVFNPLLARPRPRPDPLLLVVLQDGSRLYLSRFRLLDGQLHGTTSWGMNISLPVAHLALATLITARFPRLTDLEPQSVEQQPYLDWTLPVGWNRTADGQALQFDWFNGRATADWGLALKPRTVVHYNLEARFQRLLMWVALDPAAPTRSRARLRLLADGQVLSLPQEGLCTQGAARLWNIPLSNVRKLTLIADFPASGEAGAVVICGWPRLIR